MEYLVALWHLRAAEILQPNLFSLAIRGAKATEGALESEGYEDGW